MNIIIKNRSLEKLLIRLYEDLLCDGLRDLPNYIFNKYPIEIAKSLIAATRNYKEALWAISFYREKMRGKLSDKDKKRLKMARDEIFKIHKKTMLYQ